MAAALRIIFRIRFSRLRRSWTRFYPNSERLMAFRHSLDEGDELSGSTRTRKLPHFPNLRRSVTDPAAGLKNG